MLLNNSQAALQFIYDNICECAFKAIKCFINVRYYIIWKSIKLNVKLRKYAFGYCLTTSCQTFWLHLEISNVNVELSMHSLAARCS